MQDALVPLLGDLVQAQELAQHDRVLAQRLVDQPLALLDALRDLDLALAVEQRHGAHLAQVHAHRVVGRALLHRRGVGDLLGLLDVEIDFGDLLRHVADGAIDDLDVEVTEAVLDLLEVLLDAEQVCRQQLLDLVEQEVSLGAAEVDELAHRGHALLDRSLGGGGLDGYSQGLLRNERHRPPWREVEAALMVHGRQESETSSGRRSVRTAHVPLLGSTREGDRGCRRRHGRQVSGSTTAGFRQQPMAGSTRKDAGSSAFLG